MNASGVTLVVVTHDPTMGARARRQLVMEDGRLFGWGTNIGNQFGLPARWLGEPGGERRLTNFLHLAELLHRAETAEHYNH